MKALLMVFAVFVLALGLLLGLHWNMKGDGQWYVNWRTTFDDIRRWFQ